MFNAYESTAFVAFVESIKKFAESQSELVKQKRIENAIALASYYSNTISPSGLDAVCERQWIDLAASLMENLHKKD